MFSASHGSIWRSWIGDCKEASREGGNRDVLTWTLPYEIMVVGYYGVVQENVAEGGPEHAMAMETVRCAVYSAKYFAQRSEGSFVSVRS